MMKKSLLLLVAFALAMAASGQRLTMNPRLSAQPVKGKYEFKTTHEVSKRGSKLPMAQSLKAPARVDIINDQPAGELKIYERGGGAMYSSRGYLFSTYQDGTAMKIVFAEDGKTAYMQDPISQAVTGAWVKADLSDDGKTLTVPLHQFVAYWADYGYGLITAWVNVGTDEDGYITYSVDERTTEAVFTIGDDGTISLEGSSGDVNNFECSGLGLIYDDDLSWAGYADWESVYTPFTDVPVALPDDAVLEDYSMSFIDTYDNSQGGKMVKVAMMDNDVYVQGFSSLVPDGVMKGTLADGKVVFPSDQYLGVGSGSFLYMTASDAELYLLENLEFDYDADTRTMTASDALAVVAGGYAQELYSEPVFAPYADHAAVPANPEVLSFDDQGKVGGYNMGEFSVPTVDTEGNFINPNDLYYRIYFDDDELFSFGPDEYPNVEDFMTDVPYYYTENYDFGEGGSFIYFYETGFHRVGIQSVFRGGGEEHASEIVYMELTDGSAPVGKADFYAGYCDDNAQDAGFTAGRAQSYDIAMFVNDPSLKGMKVTGLRISAPHTTNVSQYTGWLSNGLSLKTVDGAKVADPDITSSVANVNRGHAVVMFDEPYEIGENGFFAGYTIPVNSEEKPMAITSDKMGGGLWLHTSNALRNWTDKSSMGSPCIELILEGQQENAATIVLPANTNAKKGDPIYVNATLYNHGTATLEQGEYTYEINGVTNTATFTNNISGDHWGRNTNITIELPAIADAGNYPLTVTVTKVNNVDNQDVAPTRTGMVNIMDMVPVHRVLVEEYTGTWCGWCTRGLVAMNLLAETFGNDFIGVAYHNGDPMEITTNYPNSVGGFPNAWVERNYNVDPYYGYESAGFGIKDLVEYLKGQLATAEINVKADWIDEARTQIKADVESNFVMNASGSDYALELMLVEDDMFGPAGTEWDQHNYYATMADQYGNEPNLGPLCDMPEVMEGFHFNDVLVATTGQIAESMPESIAANTINNFDYTFNTDFIYNTSGEAIIQNKDQLHVVAIIVEKATGKVINAAKGKVGASAVTEIRDENKEVASTIYFDLTGRMVSNPDNGIFVKVVRYTDGSQQSFKVLKK